jgi:hypothetical protein
MSEVLLPKSRATATATATVAMVTPASLKKVTANRGVGSIYLSKDLLNEKKGKINICRTNITRILTEAFIR